MRLFQLIVILLFAGIYSCTKKEVPEQPELQAPIASLPIVDYRDTFSGTFEGVKINYTNIWSLPAGPSSYTYTEAAPVNYTITITKVASSYSLIYAEEFDLRQQNPMDTISISTMGTYSTSTSPSGYSSSVSFRNDSVIIHTDYGTGASGNLHNGAKFRCRKTTH